MKILSPAGNILALQAAVLHGADAVYLGLDKFNARLKADNFTQHNLRQWVDFAHFYGVEVFVTVNTLIKDSEMQDALSICKMAQDCHADAVILTDFALICHVLNTLTIPVIISTQANIHDVQTAQFFERLGASGVVLARETQLSDIMDICQKTQLNVECFLHGALCVSLSGQCYMSSFIDANSGNRGLCAQPCRKYYKCLNSKGKQINEGYLLSAKDLSGVRALSVLEQAGVDYVKIEGRNRREQYAEITAHVFSCLQSGQEVDTDLLKLAFNRGDFTNGYAIDGNFDIIYTPHQAHKGLFVGKIARIDGDSIVLEQGSYKKGDAFKIFSQGVEVANALATSDKIVFKGTPKKGDDVCLTSSAISLPQKSLHVDIDFVGKAGQLPRMEARHGAHSAYVLGQSEVQQAKGSTDTQVLCRQLRKTGGSGFVCDKLNVDFEGFLPLSQINEMRRQVLAQLTQCIKDAYLPKSRAAKQIACASVPKGDYGKLAVCISEHSAQFDYTLPDLLILRVWEFDKLSQLVKKVDTKYFVDIPPLLSAQERKKIKSLAQEKNFAGFAVSDYSAFLCALECKCDVIFTQYFGIFNTQTAQFLQALCQEQGINAHFVASCELSYKEYAQFSSSTYLFVEGDIYNMTLQHCPIRLNTGKDCHNCAYEPLIYKDQIGAQFEVKRRKVQECRFCVSNSFALSLADKKPMANYFVNLSDKDASFTQAVLDVYKNNHNINAPLIKSFTRGAHNRPTK